MIYAERGRSFLYASRVRTNVDPTFRISKWQLREFKFYGETRCLERDHRTVTSLTLLSLCYYILEMYDTSGLLRSILYIFHNCSVYISLQRWNILKCWIRQIFGYNWASLQINQLCIQKKKIKMLVKSNQWIISHWLTYISSGYNSEIS